MIIIENNKEPTYIYISGLIKEDKGTKYEKV